MFLLQLRGDYADLCLAGGTFTITPKVRARTGDPFSWTRWRYENARDVLLAAGFIEKVEAFRLSESGPQSARYRLTARGIAPADGNAARRAIAAERRALRDIATVMPANTLPA
jgi:hypothetical protein